ncbi:3858_t:CDS:2 [Ambispora leptoticha]|uniref:3858_t:CDS:1 n=1 Tax=Ambispora leptoticha TaxID=144679 RepID=A0A9N9CYF0_9GLOM|nr:3858_t:CDS:2 [Ambispora leptoticha]
MRQNLVRPTLTEITPLLQDINNKRGNTYAIVDFSDVADHDTKDYKSIDNLGKSAAEIRASRWKTVKAIAQLVLLFCVALGFMYISVQLLLPPIEPDKRDLLKLPTNIEELQALKELLSSYMDKFYPRVLAAFIILYIFLQTFSIPGSMWLSILGGALFGLPVALPVVCTCCAIGSTCCYLLSQKFGKTFVKERYAEKLDQLAIHIQAHSSNLLNYIIVLRLAPFPPNWFANLAAPHVGIPLKTFMLGTFFGVAGPSVIHVQAGETINTMANSSSFHMFTVENVCALVLIGLAVLIPVFLRRRVEQKAKREALKNGLLLPSS